MRLTKVLLFFFYGLLVLLWGCSTTNHATLPKQAFHDITSHYNAYFNASEKLKAVYKTSLEYHKDKFDSVIPVYYYSDPKEFASNASDLDDVVKRSTLAIQLHPIANWSDDHFLLIGQANYLKGDYDKASSSFKYITTEYKEGVDYVKVMKKLEKPVKKYVRKKAVKKKPVVRVIKNADGTQTLEKVDMRPEYSLWIHEPARSEALIWLIKTYSRQSKFTEASSVITYTRGDDLFYRNLDYELDLAEADLRVSQKDYASAIAPLEKYLNAKKVKHNKRLRVRPLFVLAQCYATIGNYSKAIENYKLVLKSRPNYDMEFYAKIKMAKLGRGGSGDNKEMRSLLAKMAKDKKYNDYWDQVYYELALIALAENNRAEARKLLHKSIDNSTANDDQKALSFLKLAELDYEDEEYINAKFFYDSTMTFMTKNDVRYPDIEERNRILDNLVKQLNTIAREDSLQRLAALPEDQRESTIRRAVLKMEEEEETKKTKQDPGQNQLLQNNTQQNKSLQQINQQQGGGWYFYNTTARAAGYNDFIKKWGRRKLEENWRRKNKSSVTTDDTVTGTDTSGTSTDIAETAGGTVEEQMRSSIPTTPEKMRKSDERLIDAYYSAGVIYKDGLENYRKADEMFETLNSRFPKNKLLLESYYNIYLIAQKRILKDRAEEYKSKILNEFPESIIAKVLRNPNFIFEAKQKEQAVDAYYQTAYNDYATHQLDSAWYKCEMADNLFKPNLLSAKFRLLSALILAKQNRLSDYVQALNKIINTTTDMEVKATASDLLAALNKSALPQIDLSKDPAKRDSMNAVFTKPETSENALLKKLNEVKEQAKQSGIDVKEDTTSRQQMINDNQKTNISDTTVTLIITDTFTAVHQPVIEDTTSPYFRSDAAVHYFVIYIKDPLAPQSAVMSIMAKVNAFNSSQFPDKKLTARQILIDKENKLLRVNQFKNREDGMSYYNSIKTQSQLFNELKPEQFAITLISIVNFQALLDEKDIDAYNKYFKRVYK